jgi:short-chain fatty acids transporter
VHLIARLGLAARRGFGRITPDPFVLAIALTAAVMLVAVTVGAGGETLADRLQSTLSAWSGKGVWGLLAFGMQASLMLVLGTALAEAPAIRSTIVGLASRANTPRRLVGLVATVSIALGLINWSLSLIGGAILARAAGRHARARGMGLDYPLLAAAGYAGLMTWHGGLSGTAPLKATQLSDLEEVLGAELAAKIGVMPLDTTLLGDLNLFVSGGLLILGPLFFMALTPTQDPEPRPYSGGEDDPRPVGGEAHDPTEPTGLERFERSAWVIWALALPMLASLGVWYANVGLGRIDLNTVNLALWAAGLIAHGRPDRFVAACERGIRGATGIFLQFPLYAGIMGMMAASGLSARLSSLVADAGEAALLPLTFLSAGLLNLFVPSGGGQWAVQGPIIMEAALRTGTAPEHVMMAMAYGDQLTNMLQPFWALPLLAITGCRAREIVGYTASYMILGLTWTLLGLSLFV